MPDLARWRKEFGLRKGQFLLSYMIRQGASEPRTFYALRIMVTAILMPEILLPIYFNEFVAGVSVSTRIPAWKNARTNPLDQIEPVSIISKAWYFGSLELLMRITQGGVVIEDRKKTIMGLVFPLMRERALGTADGSAAGEQEERIVLSMIRQADSCMSHFFNHNFLPNADYHVREHARRLARVANIDRMIPVHLIAEGVENPWISAIRRTYAAHRATPEPSPASDDGSGLSNSSRSSSEARRSRRSAIEVFDQSRAVVYALFSGEDVEQAALYWLLSGTDYVFRFCIGRLTRPPGAAQDPAVPPVLDVAALCSNVIVANRYFMTYVTPSYPGTPAASPHLNHAPMVDYCTRMMLELFPQCIEEFNRDSLRLATSGYTWQAAREYVEALIGPVAANSDKSFIAYLAGTGLLANQTIPLSDAIRGATSPPLYLTRFLSAAFEKSHPSSAAKRNQPASDGDDDDDSPSPPRARPPNPAPQFRQIEPQQILQDDNLPNADNYRGPIDTTAPDIFEQEYNPRQSSVFNLDDPEFDPLQPQAYAPYEGLF